MELFALSFHMGFLPHSSSPQSSFPFENSDFFSFKWERHTLKLFRSLSELLVCFFFFLTVSKQKSITFLKCAKLLKHKAMLLYFALVGMLLYHLHRNDVNRSENRSELYKPGVGIGSCCLRKEHMPRKELLITLTIVQF